MSSTLQDVLGCSPGVWWNGVQYVAGNPLEIFPKCRQHANTGSGIGTVVERDRWRILPIPGKIPVLFTTERLLTAELFTFENSVEYNFVIYRDNSGEIDYCIVQEKKRWLAHDSNSPVNRPIIIHGLNHVFVISAIIDTNLSLSYGNTATSNTNNLVLQVYLVNSNISTCICDFYFRYSCMDRQMPQDSLNSTGNVSSYQVNHGDLWFAAGFFSAFDITSLPSVHLPLDKGTQYTKPRFVLPNPDVIRKPLIPKLTATSPLATASSVRTGNYDAWRAFSQNTSLNFWHSNTAPTETQKEWIKIDTGVTNEVVKKYTFNIDTLTNASLPKGWKLYGSNDSQNAGSGDNGVWELLDSRTADDAEQFRISLTNVNTTISLLFLLTNNTSSYRWYKLEFDGTVVTTSITDRIGIGNFQLYSAYSAYPPVDFQLTSIEYGTQYILFPTSIYPVEIPASGGTGNVTFNFEGKLPVSNFGVSIYKDPDIMPVLGTFGNITSNLSPTSFGLTPANLRTFIGSTVGSVHELEFRLYETSNSTSHNQDILPENCFTHPQRFWIKIAAGSSSS